VSGSLKLVIRTRAEGRPAGADTAIVKVPPRWYGTLDGQRMLVAALAGRDLRVLSEGLAADIGEKLHHAEWTLTSDPEQVRVLGLVHDCAACRAGVNQALAFLAENPDGELAVGRLWWA
jgi:hypothetical protein